MEVLCKKSPSEQLGSDPRVGLSESEQLMQKTKKSLSHGRKPRAELTALKPKYFRSVVLQRALSTPRFGSLLKDVLTTSAGSRHARTLPQPAC